MTTTHGPQFTTDATEQAIAQNTRTLVIGPYSVEKAGVALGRSPEARLDEAVGLAGAIDLDIVGAHLVPLRAIRPATYIGTGKIEEITAELAASDVGLVVMDCALSPVQQRNLEKAFSCKVIDRTGLILEIFGRRARTREGALQVEHAHLAYQKGRLVRSWTHLERQRGGFGFLGGPGETQIEADRRLLQERMKRIERDLDAVKRTRSLHRSSREKVPFPTVALVGYTNAGKSTLFNCLTQADVLAKDMLFATLDTTTRLIALPHGMKVILSDTVGFISDLPTMLVAAFRATLEDVVEADVILHVRDIAHEDAAAQGSDVEEIMGQLGIGPGSGHRIIEVWNKADVLPEADRQRLENQTARPGEADRVLVSALTGHGIDRLRNMIEATLMHAHVGYRVVLPPERAGDAAWLHQNTSVMARETQQDGTLSLDVLIAPEGAERLEHRYGSAAQKR